MVKVKGKNSLKCLSHSVSKHNIPFISKTPKMIHKIILPLFGSGFQKRLHSLRGKQITYFWKQD